VIIYDRDGEITIEVQKKIITPEQLKHLTKEQVAAQIADALGEPVFWLDRAPTPSEEGLK
jgi:hypothetical protein